MGISSVATAQPAPYHRYRTLDTKHFRVTVPAGLEREGRVAGAVAEAAYEKLARELHEPRGPIDLVVSDDADYSNGFATTLTTNRIVVFATPPIESGSLRFNEDWLQLVITHELTHIFHLDRTTGIWRLAQGIFGRAPGLFPNSYAPSWITEGLAVYYESRFTEGGRLKDAEHRLIARAQAAEHKLPALNQLSLATTNFPGGSGTYIYGSLFLDWLSRTRGDSTIRRLVDQQSGELIPWRLNHQSRAAFGISFSDAYAAWRDSVQRSVDTLATYAHWRELTTHRYYALDPRWRNDSLLTYWANDGRSTAAAYDITVNGERRRIGRRNDTGPSVPLADGSLLFAQPEVSGTAEVRSDLYIEKGGRQRRITHDMRLVQPDARRDGNMVAVQIAATRTSLMLLSPDAREHRMLREAAPDETWSEPRWSPDGTKIAAVHRTHGGLFSLEVIDIAADTAQVVDRGRYLISSPTWGADGNMLAYTSEQTGAPLLVNATLESLARLRVTRGALGEAVYTPEFSPSGTGFAAVLLRADGYHLGVAIAGVQEGSPYTASLAPLAPADSEPLAPGEYHGYGGLRGALPHYWSPIIEDSPSGGVRLGFSTSGHDVVYRHIYDLDATVATTGPYRTASLAYRYAGLRRPFIDFSVSQDYTRDATLTNGGTTDDVGYVLRRTKFASLGATFTRPRVRTFASLSFGAGLEQRSFATNVPQYLKQLSSVYQNRYLYPSAFLAGQWSNLQRPSLSISPEDGISLAFTTRVRTRTDSASDRVSANVVGTASAFKSLDLPGFSHHVLAVRAAAGVADRKTASGFEIGGTSGGTIEIIPTYTVGEGRKTFGVRGFEPGVVVGTTAFAGTIEYRAPLSVGSKGLGALPFFFDRSSVSLFADGGYASCASSLLNAGVCSPAARLDRTIASAGAELVLTAALFDWDVLQRVRFGVAVPVASRDLASRSASVYLAYGLSF
ncbi:MAG: hypothetical protein ABIY52_01930 [Gemmatimonadaceae bacterium]